MSHRSSYTLNVIGADYSKQNSSGYYKAMSRWTNQSYIVMLVPIDSSIYIKDSSLVLN